MRNLVGDDRRRRGEAQQRIGKEASGDEHAVGEIVDAGADQVHACPGVRNRDCAGLGHAVGVAPADELLDDEEREDAQQHEQAGRGHRADLRGGIRDQMQEGIPQQHADGQADQEGNDAAQVFRPDPQRKGAAQGDEADQYCGRQGLEPAVHEEYLQGVFLVKLYSNNGDSTQLVPQYWRTRDGKMRLPGSGT